MLCQRTNPLQMGNRQPSQIGRADIERWMGTFTRLAPGTARNRFVIVRGWFEWLVDDDKIRRSPMRRLHPPKVPKSRHRALSPGEVAAVLAACPDALALAYSLLGFQCGLRAAETAGIELGDLIWPRQSVVVTGKGSHVRTVYIPDEAWFAVQHYLRISPTNGGPLFRLRRFPTQPISAQWLGEDFVKIAYDAGVKHTPRDGVSYHACRHTAATDIFLACRDPLVVQRILGHQSLDNTERYIGNLDDSMQREAMEGRTYQVEPARGEDAA